MVLLNWLRGVGINTYGRDGLVEDCGNSSANALELLQSYTKPSKGTLKGNKASRINTW